MARHDIPLGPEGHDIPLGPEGHDILFGPEADMRLSVFEHLPLHSLGQAARACSLWRAEYRGVVPRDSAHMCDPSICTSAVRHCAPLGMLEYLRARGCPWGDDTLRVAAAGGRSEMIRHLRAHGCPWGVAAFEAAAACGHLEAAVCLRELGCYWDCSVTDAAASHGHLEMLKFLHLAGCPWDVGSSISAAAGGHLEVIKYLHAGGCPRDSRATASAAGGGHLDVVEYLVGYGYPYSAEVVFAAAVKFGWLEDIQYRILHGYLRSAPDFAEALNAYPELRQGGTDVCHVTRLHPVV